MNTIHVCAGDEGHLEEEASPEPKNKGSHRKIFKWKNRLSSINKYLCQYQSVLTTNFKLLCIGKRRRRKYCGVSKYRSIIVRNSAPLSLSSPSCPVLTTVSTSDDALLSNTTTCLNIRNLHQNREYLWSQTFENKTTIHQMSLFCHLKRSTISWELVTRLHKVILDNRWVTRDIENIQAHRPHKATHHHNGVENYARWGRNPRPPRQRDTDALPSKINRKLTNSSCAEFSLIKAIHCFVEQVAITMQFKMHKKIDLFGREILTSSIRKMVAARATWPANWVKKREVAKMGRRQQKGFGY